jgi:hypothetical protein
MGKSKAKNPERIERNINNAAPEKTGKSIVKNHLQGP